MKLSRDFKCSGPECVNTCCSGEIKLSVFDMKRLGVIFKAGNYYVNNVKIDLFFDQRSGLPYGLLNKNGKCPLLKDGLCSRYADRPLVCRAYPFMIFYPEVMKLELNNGCKGVPSNKWDYVAKSNVEPLVKELKEHERVAEQLKNYSMNELAQQIIQGKILKKHSPENFIK
ncbi:MAG: YkgJ family cysteine cluster protein [Candidatus Nanoarchaeia archaeon]|jgi:Fe-S-cluster containining protein